MKKPILVVPKGRLYETLKSMFESKGISMPDAESRQYFYPDWSEDCALFIAKPRAVPQLIYSKFAEFGLCGLDIMRDFDHNETIDDISDLGLCPVKICLCSRLSFEELTHLKRPVVVATEFTGLASKYFAQLGVPHYILNTSGSTEGYLDINADCIIDVVDTGATLKENNIDILKTLFVTTTHLYGNIELCDCALPKNILKIL